RSSLTLLRAWGGDGLALLEHDSRLARADEAARLPHDDADHGEAKQQHAVLGRIEILAEHLLEKVELAQKLGAADDDDRRDGDAGLAAHSAENDNRKNQRRLVEIHRFGADETLPRREECTGKPA